MAESDKEKLINDDDDMEQGQGSLTDCSLSIPPASIHHSPNPDPPQHRTKTTLNQDILEKRPTQTELFELLSPISAQWILIGMALNVDQDFLIDLEIESATCNAVKLDKLLDKWLVSVDEDLITWGEVIAALEGDIVNKKEIADKIRQYLIEHQ